MDPWGMIMDAVEHCIEMFFFLDLDLVRLLEASRDLLKLNTVLAALKPAAAGLMKMWCVQISDIQLRARLRLALCCRFCISSFFVSQENPSVQLIFFADCLPSKHDIQRARGASYTNLDAHRILLIAAI
jgi:hypothetical protein